MIETRRLKNVVIFIQTILSFVLSRTIKNKYQYHKYQPPCKAKLVEVTKQISKPTYS